MAALILLASSFSANAYLATTPYQEYTLVFATPVTDYYFIGGAWISNGMQIAYCDQWISTCVLAPPHYSLPQYVNDGIYEAMWYAINHGVNFRWGQCYSNGATPPCMQ